MANTGFWAAALEGTPDKLNQNLLQKGAEGDFDVTQTGLTFYETATGKIKRSNGTTWDEVVQVDPGTTVAGIRTLGTGAQQAAAGDHQHTLTEEQGLRSGPTNTAHLDGNSGGLQSNLNSTPVTLRTIAPTVGGSGKNALVYVGSVFLDKTTPAGTAITYTLAIKRGGVTKFSNTDVLINANDKDLTRVVGMEADVPAGSQTVTLVLSSDSDTDDDVFVGADVLFVVEVSS